MQISHKRQLVVNAARDLIGVKWRHRGRNRRGIDCVGLVVLARRAAKLPVEDQRGYGREPWNDRLRVELTRQFGEPVDAYSPGDIALFKTQDDPSHVGIIAKLDGRNSIIHCPVNGFVTEHILIDGPFLKLVEVYGCGG